MPGTISEICPMAFNDPSHAEPSDSPVSDRIAFFVEEVDFKPEHSDALREWVLDTAQHEGFSIESLSFIFCSDAHLLGINQQYLEHDTYTDIITFPYSDTEGSVHGDVFISVERVRENAAAFGVPFEHELHRVVIHGVLHLVGYVDGTEADKAFMRKKEDFYLERRPPALLA